MVQVKETALPAPTQTDQRGLGLHLLCPVKERVSVMGLLEETEIAPSLGFTTFLVFCTLMGATRQP